MEKKQIKIDINKLIEYKNNNKIHSKDQIEKLKSSIKKVGYITDIYVDENNEILAGHGRKQALVELGYKEIEVIQVSGLDENQKRTYRLLDNKIAELAEDNLPNIKIELDELNDLELNELYDLNIEEIDLEQEKSEYTKKVESPIYEIKGKLPEIKELYDNEKTKELKSKINSLNVKKEIKDFLIASADRFNVFNYSKIAEFYAHQDKETKDIMEDLALVIIDLNKAIENGFIHLEKDFEALRNNYLGNE